MKNKEIEILNEICREEECALYRIEKIVEGEKND